jgi:outer membrane cobalamin receptor
MRVSDLLKRSSIILLLACNAGQANSQSKDLFSLSLAELMNIEVVTASKKTEHYLDAPSVITVISSQDIRAFGARHVKDILQRVTNLFLFDSGTFMATGVTMRAGATQHLNNHVLYLINGRPMRESQNGGVHTDINLLLPVELIDRIEIVRGPGSVLYGSNAFSGTINFITHKTNESYVASASTHFGSNGYRKLGAGFGANSANGSLNVYANTLDESGQNLNAIDENMISDSRAQNLKGDSVFIDAQYHGFKLMVMSSEITTPIFSGAFLWQNDTDIKTKRSYYDVGYDLSFDDNWTASINLTYNKSQRLIYPTDTVRESEFLSDGYLYEATVFGKISDSLNLVSGFVVDYVQGDLYGRGGKYKTIRRSAYAQIDYQLLGSSKLIIGTQWNNPENDESKLSPRLGLIHRFNNHWSTKVLYGEAFRSPYGSELYFQSGFLLGEQDLKPEVIQTTEVQLNLEDEYMRLGLTLYHSKTTDSIGRSNTSGTNTFVNLTDEVTFNGVEFEADIRIDSDWRMQGSYSFQNNKDEYGQQQVMPAHQKMLKAGVVYSGVAATELGLWNTYLGAASKVEDLKYQNTIVVNPDAQSVNLLSLNMNMNVGQTFSIPYLNRTEVSLFANNLLDEEVFFPELGRRIVNTYPQSHDRSIYLSLEVSF